MIRMDELILINKDLSILWSQMTLEEIDKAIKNHSNLESSSDSD